MAYGSLSGTSIKKLMQYFQFVFPLNDGLLSDNVDGPEVWQGNYDARQFHGDK